MSHSDPTTLALAALGEDIEPGDASHLAACAQCTTDVAELASVVALGREAPAELPPVPDHVWSVIERELGLGGAPDGHGSTVTTLPPPRAEHAQPPADSGGDVVRLEPRRGGRSRLWATAAVAAVAGAVIGGSVVWSAVERGTDGSGSQSSEAFIAQAVLDPLSDSVPEPGEAQVLDSPDGRVVRVDARSLPDNDGFYEVWLLDAQATKLVALGALPAGSVGTFTVPPGLSLADFPVVDISLEDYDGDPTHSTNSLMRGVLET